MTQAWQIIAFWLALAFFPIVFTQTGWRYVVVPIIWPLIKLAFKSFVALFWVGLFNAIWWSGLCYRTWGFTMLHVANRFILSDIELWTFYYKYERDHNLLGLLEPNWRLAQGLEPIELSWQYSPGTVWHLLPFWTVFLIPLGGAWWLFRKIQNKRIESIILARKNVILPG